MRTFQAALSGAVAPKFRIASGLALLTLLAWPGARQFMEASMTRHMLLQFPLLMLVGGLLATALPDRWRQAGARWNAHGISGLLAAALILALLMTPRALDLALVSPGIEALKFAALLVCGAAISQSWRPAGWVVQGFFLGNVLPMMAVAGTLYETSPVRVCNAYLMDDQVQLGRLLVWVATAVAAIWLVRLLHAFTRTTEPAAPESR